MNIYEAFCDLQKKTKGYWAGRVLTEIECAIKINELSNGAHEQSIKEAVRFLTDQYVENHTISKSDAITAENLLQPINEIMKQYTMHCVAHAHIDMNWMWGFTETVSITLDTFRTMLDMIVEYPQFIFSQSQASTYRIVEKYDSEMLAEIKERIKQGRWEVTASTWVEADKNMPNGESFARHVLYTKRYFKHTFDIDPDDLTIDYEPDTFGHNWSVPEIMNKSGVKYYYHHRAYDGHFVYRWRSRNDAEVLVFRDPKGYNATVSNNHVPFSLQFCIDAGIKDMLYVYGVGDHGGGPTRRDIERLIDMQSWPITPVIKFSTYSEFYNTLENIRESLPIVKQELNFVFTGCYTTQSRIKKANRIAEDRLYCAEVLSTSAMILAGGTDQTKSYAGAWERVLFSQFHDILTGSGIIDTREYALSEFQKAMATVNTNASRAMRQIAAQIDTNKIIVDEDNLTISEGGGVGYGVSEDRHFNFPQTERGRGKTRLIHIFNPTEYNRTGLASIVIWDWNYDENRMLVKDSYGNVVRHQIVKQNDALSYFKISEYWGHTATVLLVDVNIPAFGYNTYVVTENRPESLRKHAYLEGVADYYNDEDKVLENKHIRAVFKSGDMRLISLFDKKTGKELIKKDRPACAFRLIQEDTIPGMSAWRVGRYAQITDLNDNEKIIIYDQEIGELRQSIKYKFSFERSSMDVCVFLDENSDMLNFDIIIDWQETGSESFVPQLNFSVPFAFSASKYRYDIPFATVDRKPIYDDTPGNSFIMAIPDKLDDRPLMLVSDTKYGYRGDSNCMSVNLIRSATFPDPYPENGNHKIRLGVGLINSLNNNDVFCAASAFVTPLPFVSGTAHEGALPTNNQIFKLFGDVKCSAVKMTEEGDGIVFRLYDVNGLGSKVSLLLSKTIGKANLSDLTEMKDLGSVHVNNNKLSFDIRPYEVVTLKVFLDEV